jgi:hypothetical protein
MVVNIDEYEITIENFKNNKSEFCFYSFDTRCGKLLSELSDVDINQNIKFCNKQKTNIPINKAYIYILSEEILNRRKDKLLKIKERICSIKMK